MVLAIIYLIGLGRRLRCQSVKKFLRDQGEMCRQIEKRAKISHERLEKLLRYTDVLGALAWPLESQVNMVPSATGPLDIMVEDVRRLNNLALQLGF